MKKIIIDSCNQSGLRKNLEDDISSSEDSLCAAQTEQANQIFDAKQEGC